MADRTCSVEDCERSAEYADGGRRGMCGLHVRRWYASGGPRLSKPESRFCTITENGTTCRNLARYTGMCEKHYQRLTRTGTTDRGPKGTDICEGTEVKTCRTCKEVKPRSEFGLNRNKGDGLLTHCKPCARAAHYRVKYRITPDEFDALLAFQGGVCGLCCGPPARKGWCVEHDHSTGEVRAVVCNRCNLLLGMANDSTERLQAAIGYLLAPPAERMKGIR